MAYVGNIRALNYWSWSNVLMKSLTYAVILLTITAFTPPILAQSKGAGGAGKRSPEIVGEVERSGAQIQLVLTNPSDTRAFQGAAKVSVGLSADAAIQLTINLGPNETRRFPLPTSKQAAPASKKSSEELRVNARLTRNLAGRDAELPTTNQAEPFLLTFEIESDTLVKNASFTLSAKDFQRRQPITIEARAALEFKLPDTLNKRKLSYTLTSATGQTLASGEVDLDQLTASDAVSVGALTFDRPAYTRGESARVVIELQGD